MIEVKPMRKFKIPNIPATEPKSIRFPVDVISEVEHTIRGKDCTFSAFVVEAVRVALESLREEDEELDVSEKDIEEKWKNAAPSGKGAAFFLPLGQSKRKDAPEGVPSKGKNMKRKLLGLVEWKWNEKVSVFDIGTGGCATYHPEFPKGQL